MDEQFLNSINQILTLMGGLLRPLGSLVLGAVAGWLTVETFQEAEKRWQLQIAAFLGLLGGFVTLNIYSGAGTSGAYALGAGLGAVIVLIMRNAQAKAKK